MSQPELPRLAKLYVDEIRPALMKQGGFDNVMQLPILEKIVLNMGIGKATQDRKHLTSAVEELTLIAGQRAVPTKARKSEAAFKLREGMGIGVKVTLRKKRMYEFVDRLINIAMPRQRDFRGLNPKSFDGHGNFAMGIREHIVFPEIDYDQTDEIRGLDIIVCTSAKTDEHARMLLEAFKFPFRS